MSIRKISSSVKVRRNAGSICKQQKLHQKDLLEQSFKTEATEETQSKTRSPFGRIVKNQRKRSTQSSFLSKIPIEDLYHQEPEFAFSKKLKVIEDKYNERLTKYQSTKRGIINEIRQISRSNKKGSIKKSNLGTSQKKDHFLIEKLRETVAVVKKSQTLKNQETNEHEFSFQTDTLMLKGKRQPIKVGIYERYKEFFMALDRMVGFQQTLRRYKLSINAENRGKVTDLLNKIYPMINSLELMKVDYEEYEFDVQTPPNISPQTIAEGIIELSSKCETFWNQTVRKKLSEYGAKQIYDLLNYNKCEVQIDLKTFVRELNYQIGKNYQPKDLYRVHRRLSPLTKGNFMIYFTQ